MQWSFVFCDKDGKSKILSVFENVNLQIFLRALDFDARNSATKKNKYEDESFVRMEKKRHKKFVDNLSLGLRDAATIAAEEDEKLLSKLKVIQ